MPKSFILYQDYAKSLKILSQSQKGDLLDAIFAFNDDQEIQLEPVVEMAFSFIRSDLERNKEKYQRTVERNKANGAKGGRPLGNNGLVDNPEEPKKPTGFSDNPKEPIKSLNDNDDDNGNKINLKRFIRPNLEEIRNFCEDKRSSVDPVAFFNFYESKGWMIGKNPMKNWKAAIATWESKRSESIENKGQQKTNQTLHAIFNAQLS